eukprot:m.96921 g.96921  ORF g.96921 m.96921 type:complete len:464 (-) comp26940_c0_seq1:370-1761(-)
MCTVVICMYQGRLNKTITIHSPSTTSSKPLNMIPPRIQLRRGIKVVLGDRPSMLVFIRKWDTSRLTATGHMLILMLGTLLLQCCTSKVRLGLAAPAGFLHVYNQTNLARAHAHLQVACQWNDTSQAEAYAHTLTAFYASFPEYASNDLYLTGESYAGQYVPNIAHYILNNEPFTSKINLKGLALGNACWGGNATKVQCNGPNREQNMADIYYGKGLSSKELYDQIYKTCQWPNITNDCSTLLEQQSKQVGPHNIYDIYDNCPRTAQFLKVNALTMYDLQTALNLEMDTGVPATLSLERKLGVEAGSLGGGYPWACGGMDDVKTWLTQDNVKKALHLGEAGLSTFSYHSSGPASITLHPELATKLRVLIYNGDADACVPYKGNMEWITSLVTAGDLVEAEAWRPWFNDLWPDMPAGYVTDYNVTKAPTKDFHFLTIRLAGHMVPTFQPASSLSFFQRFLAHQPF